MKTALLPRGLYTAAAVRELDRLTIEEHGVPGLTLMRRAGTACVAVLRDHWPDCQRVLVLCGKGNNAGDGYVIAGQLAEANCQVWVRTLGEPGAPGSDARFAYDYCLHAGVVPLPFDPLERFTPDVIVDAMLGTGIRGEVRPDYAEAIDWTNRLAIDVPVLAVDLPSGLEADTGSQAGVAVQATVTVTFIGLKQGLFTLDGPDCAGEIVFDDLAVPPGIYQAVPPKTQRLDYGDAAGLLPRRPRNAHKNRFGHVVIVGGDDGMGGAVAMAGDAALRAGAGLVSVVTHPAHAATLLARRPELMVRGVQDAGQLDDLLERASVVVVGPGLGQSHWSRQLFERVMVTQVDSPTATVRLVVDADGLNLLAAAPRHCSRWVLTPHPGEAARLLPDRKTDRFAMVQALQRQFGGAVVLKGAGSLVADESELSLCSYGNPGMATAGMGDVLSGVTGALLAQDLTPGTAARLAVMVHAMAGDEAALKGERGLIATDILPFVRRLLNPDGA